MHFSASFSKLIISKNNIYLSSISPLLIELSEQHLVFTQSILCMLAEFLYPYLQVMLILNLTNEV